MKYLFLLLVLGGCAAPQQGTVVQEQEESAGLEKLYPPESFHLLDSFYTQGEEEAIEELAKYEDFFTTNDLFPYKTIQNGYSLNFNFEDDVVSTNQEVFPKDIIGRVIAYTNKYGLIFINTEEIVVPIEELKKRKNISHWSYLISPYEGFYSTFLRERPTPQLIKRGLINCWIYTEGFFTYVPTPEGFQGDSEAYGRLWLEKFPIVNFCPSYFRELEDTALINLVDDLALPSEYGNIYEKYIPNRPPKYIHLYTLLSRLIPTDRPEKFRIAALNLLVLSAFKNYSPENPIITPLPAKIASIFH